MTNQQINDDNLQFVDISGWTGPYVNDGIDEGVRIDGIVVKAADGVRDYSKPGSWEYVQYWKAQWASISEFARKWMFHWYQTEQQPTVQAKLAISICDKFAGQIDVWVVDFEQYKNIINATTIKQFASYIDIFTIGSPVKLVLYVNDSTYDMVVSVLGQDWADAQEWWFAGGEHYNAKLDFFPAEDFFENLFNYPGRVAVQWSADGNQQADEHDFGTKELSSIDMNYVYFTPEEYDIWLGRLPVSHGEEEIVIELISEPGGIMLVDKDLVDHILENATNINVNLNINVSAPLDGVPMVLEDDPVVEVPKYPPNTMFVTVQHPTKGRGFLSTWRSKNAKGFPIFTAWPTDGESYVSSRIFLLNGAKVLVEKVPVKGDNDKYGFKVVDWDGYFARLSALGKDDEPLDVNKLYIRTDWAIVPNSA